MADSGSETIGSVASSVTSSFNLTNLITASSYLAGVGFSLASIEKFKMHKDNPTQIPIGTPDALAGVAAVLTYLPGIESVAAKSGVSAADVKAAAGAAGVTKSDVESAAEAAGATSAQVSAAEAEVKAKTSG